LELSLHKHITVDGQKNFFRCNKVNIDGKQFDACIYLLFKCTNDQLVLFRDKSVHIHHSKISNQVKQVINELFLLKLNSKAIIEIGAMKKMKCYSLDQNKIKAFHT